MKMIFFLQLLMLMNVANDIECRNNIIIYNPKYLSHEIKAIRFIGFIKMRLNLTLNSTKHRFRWL